MVSSCGAHTLAVYENKAIKECEEYPLGETGREEAKCNRIVQKW